MRRRAVTLNGLVSVLAAIPAVVVAQTPVEGKSAVEEVVVTGYRRSLEDSALDAS